MKDLLKKNLSEEVFEQVSTALGNNFDYVPRTRLNEVIAQRDGFKGEVDELKGKAGQVDDLIAKRTALETALADEKAGRTADSEAHAKVVLEMTIDNTVTTKLMENKVKNVPAAKALLNYKEFGDDLAGIDAEIAKAVESAPYLFGEDIPAGTGKDGGTPGSPSTSEVEKLQKAHAEALKNGDITLAVSLKNKLFEAIQKEKK